MPNTAGMSQHVPLAGSSGAPRSGEGAPRADARPGHDEELARELAALFVDADRHGPRWPVLVRRVALGAVVVPLTIGMAASERWRSVVLDASSGSVADVALVGPVLLALVIMAAAFAPLARINTVPVLAAAVVLLVIGALVVSRGDIVVGAVASAPGAGLLGIAAARAIRRAVWLMPLLLAAGVSDVHSVERGVTRDLLGDAPSAVGTASAAPQLTLDPTLLTRLDLLVLHLPASSSTWLIGMVDVMALGLLLGLAHVFWLPVARSAAALGGVLCVAVLFDVPVPLLPLLGLAWVVVHARLVWRATRFELRRLTYLGG